MASINAKSPPDSTCIHLSGAPANCNTQPSTIYCKLLCHYNISSTTKTYVHENYWIRFMLILTYSHHICIFGDNKNEKASPTSVQTLKNMRSAHFLNTQSQGSSNRTIALNKRVYLMKIKLLIQQVQSHFFTPIDQHIGVGKRIDFDTILLLSRWNKWFSFPGKEKCFMWFACNTFFFSPGQHS